MKAKCLMCGKLFEVNQQEDPDDFLSVGKKASVTFCTFCELKLKKESEDKNKPRKPM